MIKNPELKEHGFIIADFPLDPHIQTMINDKNWKALDSFFLDLSRPNGALRCFLQNYLDFETLEHIIAIRKAPEDEDGIWHDDGSRFLGFSLSLNLHPEKMTGGELRFKQKELPLTQTFPIQQYGKIILFLSGLFGYEHMVSAVTKGERIVIAGWCS